MKILSCILVAVMAAGAAGSLLRGMFLPKMKTGP